MDFERSLEECLEKSIPVGVECVEEGGGRWRVGRENVCDLE